MKAKLNIMELEPRCMSSGVDWWSTTPESHKDWLPFIPPPQVRVIQATGSALGKIEVSNDGSSAKLPVGWFSLLGAQAYESNYGVPKQDWRVGTQATAPYGIGLGPYQTDRLVQGGVFADKFRSTAFASAKQDAFSPTMHSWTGSPSEASIVITNDKTPNVLESAEARVAVVDPVNFSDASGTWTVGIDPQGSWSYSFPSGRDYQATVTLSGHVSSSDAFGAVVSYQIVLAPGHVESASFYSTFLSDVQNQAVAAQIANSYSWDGSVMSYGGGPVAVNYPVTAKGVEFTMAESAVIDAVSEQAVNGGLRWTT